MSLLLLFNQVPKLDLESSKIVKRLREQVSSNSINWTGIEERGNSDPEILEKTRGAIYEIKILIERTKLTNVEKARAIAIANALQALIESPEPEWKAILLLLSSPALNNVMAMANILLLVFQLFGLRN